MTRACEKTRECGGRWLEGAPAGVVSASCRRARTPPLAPPPEASAPAVSTPTEPQQAPAQRPRAPRSPPPTQRRSHRVARHAAGGAARPARPAAPMPSACSMHSAMCHCAMRGIFPGAILCRSIGKGTLPLPRQTSAAERQTAAGTLCEAAWLRQASVTVRVLIPHNSTCALRCTKTRVLVDGQINAKGLRHRRAMLGSAPPVWPGTRGRRR